jgi:hypothetical protein
LICLAQGALIVKAKDGAPEFGLKGSYDAEKIMFLNDWFHGQSEAMAMTLQR